MFPVTGSPSRYWTLGVTPRVDTPTVDTEVQVGCHNIGKWCLAVLSLSAARKS